MVFNNNLLLGAAGAADGYAIDQSIRFNDDDSAYLSRTPGSAGNRKTWTFSSWVKRANLFNGSVPQIIFSAANGSTLDFIMQFGQSDDTLRISDYSSGSASNLITTQLFRDPSAWYHFVLQYDTTQATSSDRMKLYVNGTQVTAFGTESYPSLNYDSAVNNNLAHNISRGAYSANGYFDGYQAEINFIDGQALDPSSFGETNADTGEWVPKAYTGSATGNSFYITGADSADLGADDSGNGNNFTSSGLTAADQRLDTPTLNKATLNGVNLYTTGSVLSDGNLTVTNSGTSGFWRRAYATQALSYKTYWEVHADNLGSLNIGLSSLKNPNGGINNPVGNFGAGIQNNEAFVAGSYANESGGSRTFPISTGNYIMFAFDPDRGALWAGTEGTWKDGTASSASSATILAEIEGTGTSYALFTGIDADDAIPHIAQYSTSTATARFSSEDWEGTAPTGYEQLAPSSLPDPTIALPEKYFNTVLYVGNGGGQRVGGFQPITETYSVPNSVIFNDNDSAYLNRTPASDGNRQIMTFSWWMKRGNLNITDCRIFTARDSNDDQINFKDTSDYNRLDVFFDGTSGGRLTTSRAFDDSSTWNHCVVAIDTTQATSGDRVKIYINGVRVTEFDTETQPSLNKNLNGFNNNAAHAIGARAWSGAAGFYDGYLAEIYFIDGQQLDASSFGQLDASTNRWIPKDASGLTFGTNGYYLDMETAPGTGSGAGTDSSGNGNNWTESGFAAADQVTDSPTDNFCVLNPNDKNSNFTLSYGNLTNSDGTNAHAACFSTITFDASDTDGWYWEVTMDSMQSTGFAVLIADEAVNQADITTDPYTQPAAGNLWAHRRYNSASDGAITGVGLTGSWTSYGPAAVNGDVIGYCVKNGKLFIAINNTWLESSDPDTEASPAFSNLTGNLKVGVNRFGDTGTDVTTLNFGQTGFTYTPPTGAKAISTDNLPLSNGDLSAFVWIKNRDATDNHMLFDAVRGVTKDIHSNTTAAEVTNANTLTRFLKNGFEVSNDAEVNTSAESYVAWQWLNDSLTTSSNTDGSITSTILANTTSGVSIIRWSGTAANGTIGHGLGIQPSLYIVKNTATTNSWLVGSTLYSNTQFLILNSTGALDTAAAVWNSAYPTSSVINLGSNAGSNGSGTNNMICYAFAEVEGFSKFGTFTGNGSTTDGPFIYTGFTPEFFMWKRTDSATYGDWTMMDTKRDPFNMAERNMRANSTIADDTGEADLDFVSNGIKHRGGSSARFNQSGANYIYMAFASSPFKTANAR